MKEKKTKKKEIEGVGDVIAVVAEATKIDKIVNYFSEDCKCEERRAELNARFPFRLKPKQLSDEDLEFIAKLQAENKQRYSSDEVKEIVSMYEKIFKVSGGQICTTCPSGVRTVKAILSNLYKLL